MQKREARFQTAFNHFLKSIHKKTGAFEIKQTNKNSIAFNMVKPHQEKALFNVKNSSLTYKIPDGSFYQSPFDCFSLANEDAFVVIKYPDFFVLIDIMDWLNEKRRSTRKSLTSDRAKEICTFVMDL